MNTKHFKEDSKTYEHITNENNMFQIELVEDETVYVCNTCDQGFEISEEVKKHIQEVHQDIINHILPRVTNKNYDLEKGANGDEECKDSDKNGGTMDLCHPESEVIEEDGMFTCTLCNERLDGNHESKQHFIKKHMKDIKQTMTVDRYM